LPSSSGSGMRPGRVMREPKQMLDPDGLMNPGKVL
jgi:FAD/FMN-containing dehydrogenase